MKKAVLLMLSLFSALSLMFLSCESDSSSGSPEFDVTLCSGEGAAKSEFEASTDAASVDFYITSKNYFDYLNRPAKGSWLDSADEDHDIDITYKETDYTRGVHKYSLSGLPSTAGTYEVTFRVNKIENGVVDKNVYKDITLTLKMTASGTTVYATPEITTQPVGKNYEAGTTTFETLTVVATVSGGTCSYQWYDVNGEITNATDSAYTPTGVGEYYVVVSNTADPNKSVKSNIAKVYVYAEGEVAAPDITVQPQSASYDTAAEIKELSVSATCVSGASMNYQWYDDDVSISGATKSTYTPTKFGTYYVKVSATKDGKTSTETVSSRAVIGEKAISITISGLSETAYVGDELKVTAKVNVETSSVTYQWYTTDENSGSDTPVSGATEATCKPTEAGKYKCKVTATSKYTGESKTADNGDSCTVSVRAADDPVTPTISKDLSTSESVDEGGSLTLSVTATTTDSGVLSYQWYKGSSKLSSTSGSYTISKAATTDAGEYYVVVTNTLNSKTASKTSVKCTVTVNATDTTGSAGGTAQF